MLALLALLDLTALRKSRDIDSRSKADEQSSCKVGTRWRIPLYLSTSEFGSFLVGLLDSWWTP
jgi:hypothetical protein